MAEELTKKEKGFADEYLETGNGVQAALNHYDTTNYDSAGVIAHRTLKKAKIQEYLEDHAEGAISRIIDLSKDAKNENVKLMANKDIADRGGFKPVERTETKTLTIAVNLDEKSLGIAKKYEEELKQTL